MSSNIKRLLRPKNIAVVGGRFAEAVIKQSDLIGFKGDIYPINAKRETIQGRQCYSSVADLPQTPDASFVAVDRFQSIKVIEELANIGAGGAVAYAAGFAEHDDIGKTLQEDLLKVKGDMAIVGPNCYGMINYLDGLCLWPDEQGGKAVEQGAAIVLQSGNIGVSLTMQQRGLPVAYLISVGNQADLEMHDYIEAFLEDERITCIGLHIEGLQDVAAFSRAAKKALEKNIPIVVLKTGRSEQGQQITMSHTSSLSGSDDLYNAMFERYGVSRASSIPQFVEMLKFLSMVGPLQGTKLASISCSGGEAAYVADLASSEGFSFPELTQKQHEGLFEVLGEKVHLSNPLDYHTYIWNDEPEQLKCFSAMASGEQDVTLKILDYPKPELCDVSAWDKTARAFATALKERNAKGVIVSTLPENLPEIARDFCISQGIAPMQGLEDCLASIAVANKLHNRHQHLDIIESLSNSPIEIQEEQIITLDETSSKALLANYGITSPKSAIISHSLENAESICNDIGYPLVIKVLSENIIHKSDVGGVHLNIQNYSEAKTALESMEHLNSDYLVEQMLTPPITELILGINRDAQFGLSMVIGAGGIFVEILQDSQTLLLPTNKLEIEKAIKQLKTFPLLDGYRGQQKVNIESLIITIENLTTFALEHQDSLFEVDINPLFVYESTTIAADAVIRKTSSTSS